MNKFLAVIAAEQDTQAILAAEALKSAAHDAGLAIDTLIQVDERVMGAATEAHYRQVLVVGEANIPKAYAGLSTHGARLDAVLANAAAVLAELEGGVSPSSARDDRFIVAITSCPTGIAHTFMAAEGLQQAAKALGYRIRVETQGSVGAQTPLTAEEIAEADLVIIASDREVDQARFAGKRVHVGRTKPAINDAQNLIKRALSEARVLQGDNAKTPQSGDSKEGASKVSNPYKHLMNGVSFMLPFITAGGLLIALGFALGGIYVYEDQNVGSLGHALFTIGAKGGFALIVPALAGYIAFSIADRPGLAPGMIGGMLAANLQAGFLGGILAGFIAGYSVHWFNQVIRLPRNLEGLKPVLILPLLGSLSVGLIMMFVVGTPVAGALAAMTEWLKSLQGSSAVLLGLMIGAMMAFDMGGPINKAAYAFATGLIASEVYTPMAAAMVAGMTAPLGVALATRLFANRFSSEEREAGGAAAVLGLAFVTEGAIPFAAKDPFRVIPSLVVGSAAAGAVSMFIGATLRVPHGGVFVLPIPNAVTHLGGYIAALVLGTVITALMLGLLKKPLVELDAKTSTA